MPDSTVPVMSELTTPRLRMGEPSQTYGLTRHSRQQAHLHLLHELPVQVRGLPAQELDADQVLTQRPRLVGDGVGGQWRDLPTED